MKKILLFAATQFIIATSHSQSLHGSKQLAEISAGVGFGSTDYLFDGYEPGILGEGTREYRNHQYSGAYYVSIMYVAAKRFSIGITGAYENERGDWLQNYNYDHFSHQTMTIGSFKRQAFTLCPEARAYYKVRNTFQIYCSLGLGITYKNEVDRYSDDYYLQNFRNGINTLGGNREINNNKVQANFYYSPFGISIGNKVRWHAEFGLGYKGIINSGMSINI